MSQARLSQGQVTSVGCVTGCHNARYLVLDVSQIVTRTCDVCNRVTPNPGGQGKPWRHTDNGKKDTVMKLYHCRQCSVGIYYLTSTILPNVVTSVPLCVTLLAHSVTLLSHCVTKVCHCINIEIVTVCTTILYDCALIINTTEYKHLCYIVTR